MGTSSGQEEPALMYIAPSSRFMYHITYAKYTYNELIHAVTNYKYSHTWIFDVNRLP